MPNWIDVAAEADCGPGQALEVVAAKRMIAIYHTEDGYFATDGMCAHQGGPVGQGELCGNIVTCPWHGWQFDVTSGQHCLNANLQHPCFAVKVEGADVLVEIP